jgi:hypothetical protein
VGRPFAAGGATSGGEEDANVFSLGMHFLHFVASRHADAFQWRNPKQGYEYNCAPEPKAKAEGGYARRLLHQYVILFNW